VLEEAEALMESLMNNHPFPDANQARRVCSDARVLAGERI
jgi:prophage maintenance system killer protein